MFTWLLNHLWQSTVFAAVAGLLTLALKRNRANLRHWIWFVASLKFLVPFAIFAAIGHFAGTFWSSTRPIAPQTAITAIQIVQPFDTTPLVPIAASPVTRPILPVLLAFLWSAGFTVSLICWYKRWNRMRVIARAATPLVDGGEVKMLQRMELVMGTRAIQLACSDSAIEPSLFGIFRPVLLLSNGIREKLTDAQFETIFAHELCHARRCDNLISAIHMLVEAIFWFHPLVWWIGARLIEERERACDEDVLRICAEPEAYAEGILNVCKYCLESSLPCASGISGSDLKRRIARIASGSSALGLSVTRRALLAGAAVVALVVPLVIGLINPSYGHAQSQPENSTRLEFDAASVKPSDPESRGGLGGLLTGGPGTPDPGRMTGRAITLQDLFMKAYGVVKDQIAGPDWIREQKYDIEAVLPPSATKEQSQIMLQNLLAERFKLVFHRVAKDFPVYQVIVANGGPKLKPTAYPDAPPVKPGEYLGGPRKPVLDGDGFPILPENRKGAQGVITNGLQRESFQAYSISDLIHFIGSKIWLADGSSSYAPGRVIDKTGLTGQYDFKLESAFTVSPLAVPGAPPSNSADAPDPGSAGPDIFTAVEKQLGLKIVKDKITLDQLVIDHAERTPTAN